MTDKLRGGTTIVTEHRTYLIDSLSKKGVSRSSVSARSPNVEQREVVVTRTQPYIIARHANKYLQIVSSFPVIAHFIPGTPETGEEEEPPRKAYTTGIIYAESSLRVNEDSYVSVFDPDVVTPTLQLTLFNATTGETEYVFMDRLENGLYRAPFRVVAKSTRGVDFDNVLNGSPGDNITLIYQDARGSNGTPVTVTKQVKLTSNFVEPVLHARRAVSPSGLIGMVVENPASPSILVRNVRTGQTQELALVEQDVYFSASISAQFFNAEVGDTFHTIYEYADEMGDLQVQTAITNVLEGDVAGVMTFPVVVERNEEFTIHLDDPDIDAIYVDLTLAGVQTSRSYRLRLYRVGFHTGIYRAKYAISEIFKDDMDLTVTYVDSSEGVPVILTRPLKINARATPPDPEVPDVEVPDVEVPAPTIALQMEIDGLFTLNGRFSGIVKIYAKEDETIRCTIITAS